MMPETMIEKVARYYTENRQAGHTTLALHGMQIPLTTGKALLFVSSNGLAQAIRKNAPGLPDSAEFITRIEDLRGREKEPLLLDNSAVVLMAREVAQLRQCLEHHQKPLSRLSDYVKRATWPIVRRLTKEAVLFITRGTSAHACKFCKECAQDER